MEKRKNKRLFIKKLLLLWLLLYTSCSLFANEKQLARIKMNLLKSDLLIIKIEHKSSNIEIEITKKLEIEELVKNISLKRGNIAHNHKHNGELIFQKNGKQVNSKKIQVDLSSNVIRFETEIL